MSSSQPKGVSSERSGTICSSKSRRIYTRIVVEHRIHLYKGVPFVNARTCSQSFPESVAFDHYKGSSTLKALVFQSYTKFPKHMSYLSLA